MALFGGGRNTNAGTGNRPKHSPFTHGIIWPLLLFTLACYIVETAGISAVQHDCNTTNLTQANAGWVQLPVGGEDCSRLFRYMWFIWAFNFFVWAYIAFATATSTLHYHYVSILAFLAITTVLHFWATNVFYNVRDAYNAGIGNHRRATVAFIGYLLKSIADCLLIFAVGLAGHKEVVRRYNLVGGDPIGHNDPRTTQYADETGGLNTNVHANKKTVTETRANVATPAEGTAIV